MKIRTRLTLQFVAIVILINIISSVSIYFFAANYRIEEFYHRLYNKASNNAKLLLTVDEIDATLLKKIEKDNPGSLPKERIIICNDHKEILFSTDENHEITINDTLIHTIKAENYYRFKQGEFEALGFKLDQNSEALYVITAAVDIYGKSKLTNLAYILTFTFGINCILAFVLGWIYSGRALMPISKIVDNVNNITINNLDLRLDEGNKSDEIAKLAETFNNMLNRLESAFKLQKKFIANASHEIRTPLTSMTGQLEVALMQERAPDDYRKVIASVLEDMKSLNNISNKLLLMAQTESEHAVTDFSSLRFDELIWQARTTLLNTYPAYKVSVSINDQIEDEAKLTITGNEHLLKIAIINLMENGCKYSDNHQTDVFIEHVNNQLIVHFSDKGIGIPEEDLKNIFQPFHRAKNAYSIKGHGIGLSLVDTILKMHRATIDVASVVNQGSVFTVRFATT
jgi:signal transduction histidine kinase